MADSSAVRKMQIQTQRTIKLAAVVEFTPYCMQALRFSAMTTSINILELGSGITSTTESPDYCLWRQSVGLPREGEVDRKVEVLKQLPTHYIPLTARGTEIFQMNCYKEDLGPTYWTWYNFKCCSRKNTSRRDCVCLYVTWYKRCCPWMGLYETWVVRKTL
jgi:hypothetical protein